MPSADTHQRISSFRSSVGGSWIGGSKQAVDRAQRMPSSGAALKYERGIAGVRYRGRGTARREETPDSSLELSTPLPRYLPLACLAHSRPPSSLLPFLRPSTRGLYQAQARNIPERLAPTASMPNRPATTMFSPIRTGRRSMGGQLRGRRTGKITEAALVERQYTSHKDVLSKTSDVDASELPFIEKRDLEVRGKVGEGTFGSVLLATWISMEQAVALKVLKPRESFEQRLEGQSITYEDIVAAFRREIRLMHACGGHPNVAPVLGTGAHDTMLVMELASMDLQKLCQKVGSLIPLQLISHWGRDILSAVAHIHACGVIHLDVKPANILIFKDGGQAKICDFGLASRVSDDLTVNRELCSLWYRAPEVLMGCKAYTPLVDEWGVGCVVLEMLIGEVPLPGSTAEARSCDCERKSHINFNADQLSRIFGLIGSPREKDVCHLGCWDHFRSWTRSHAVLSTLVRNAINQRLVTDVDIVPPHILPDTIKAWTSALSQLLTHTSKLRLPAADALALPLFQHNTSSSSASSSSARSPPPLSAPTFLSPLRISFLSSSLPAATSSPPPALPHPRSSTALPISPPLSLSSSAASNTSTADARSPLSSPDFAPQKRDEERVGMRGGRVRVRGALGQRKKEALERSSSALLLLASEEHEHEHEQRSGSLLR